MPPNHKENVMKFLALGIALASTSAAAETLLVPPPHHQPTKLEFVNGQVRATYLSPTGEVAYSALLDKNGLVDTFVSAEGTGTTRLLERGPISFFGAKQGAHGLSALSTPVGASDRFAQHLAEFDGYVWATDGEVVLRTTSSLDAEWAVVDAPITYASSIAAASAGLAVGSTTKGHVLFWSAADAPPLELASHNESSGGFGASVAFSGDDLFIGAPSDKGGAVYRYTEGNLDVLSLPSHLIDKGIGRELAATADGLYVLGTDNLYLLNGEEWNLVHEGVATIAAYGDDLLLLDSEGRLERLEKPRYSAPASEGDIPKTCSFETWCSGSLNLGVSEIQDRVFAEASYGFSQPTIPESHHAVLGFPSQASTYTTSTLCERFRYMAGRKVRTGVIGDCNAPAPSWCLTPQWTCTQDAPGYDRFGNWYAIFTHPIFPGASHTCMDASLTYRCGSSGASQSTVDLMVHPDVRTLSGFSFTVLNPQPGVSVSLVQMPAAANGWRASFSVTRSRFDISVVAPQVRMDYNSHYATLVINHSGINPSHYFPSHHPTLLCQSAETECLAYAPTTIDGIPFTMDDYWNIGASYPGYLYPSKPGCVRTRAWYRCQGTDSVHTQFSVAHQIPHYSAQVHYFGFYVTNPQPGVAVSLAESPSQANQYRGYYSVHKTKFDAPVTQPNVYYYFVPKPQ